MAQPRTAASWPGNTVSCWPTVGRAPQTDGAVSASAHDQVSSGLIAHVPHRSTVAREHGIQAAGLGVASSERAIPACTHHPLTVRADSANANCTCMSL